MFVCLFVFQIRSDKENYTTIYYSLTGPGVNEPPEGRFKVDRNTGYVRVYSILDREEISTYVVRDLFASRLKNLKHLQACPQAAQ